jgi:hypothetical protein
MRTTRLLELLLAALIACVAAASGQGTHTLRGTVADSATGEPLPAATVRIAGTAQGAVANARGEFILRLDTARTIVVSYVGYFSDTLLLRLDADSALDVRLRPSPVRLFEVVSLAEDPALEIIRQAIAHKRSWMDRLRSYRFEAFTRQVLRRDTAIASISEAYTTGYKLSGDTLREVVRQKRQTKNLSADENAAAVRRMANFNEDRITLFTININRNPSAYTFVGPTAPDALEYYDYKLLATSQVNGVETYTIAVTPKSRTSPLFSGKITIADETFAVMGVDLKPNETLAIPFLRDIDLRYRQQFALYDSLFWMPVDIRIDGGFALSIVGFSLPRIGIEQISSIYDYALNAPVPDSIIAKRPVTVDSAASSYDTAFWKEHEVLPLTPEEDRAYGSLDSTQTLDKQFEPKGPLSSLAGDGLDLLEYLTLRFNRVEGFHLGLHGRTNALDPGLTLYGEAGVGFSDNLGTFLAGATVFATPSRRVGVGAEVYRSTATFPDHDYYGDVVNTLTSLLDKNDYDDYFYAHGYRAYVTASPGRRLAATASLVDEQHYTALATTTYGLFNSSDPYRYQPPVAEGRMRSVRLDLRVGPEAEGLGIATRDAIELTAERSAPWLASSEYDFTRVEAVAEAGLPTFGSGLLFPPMLHARLAAGTSSGTLPPQRFFTLDARSSGLAPFGVLRGSRVREFSGDAYVLLSVEHNFRSLPFLLLDVPFLYRNSIELVVHASAAQAWAGPVSTTNGWYAEAGFGLSRIFDILRVDLTWRFRDPARFCASFGIATLL